MRRHNLGTVVAFEVRRTLAKPSFWLASLAVPLLMGFIIALSFLSSAAAEDARAAGEAEPVTFTYTDASGLVVDDVAGRLGGTPAPDADAAAEAVRQGRADLHISIPPNPGDGVHVVGRDLGLTESGRWMAVAGDLMRLSAAERVGDPVLTDTLDGVPITSELWADGVRSAGFGGVVAPGAFLVLLLMAVVMLGQQMLNITVEEKENRVTEMILTTIHPTTLIVGKVIGVVAVGIIQGAVLLLPLIAFALTSGGGDPAAAPGMGAGLSGADLVFDPVRIVVAAVLFVGGFLLITGLLVAIGSVMPTAKEAANAFSAVIIGLMVPLYTLPLILEAPEAPLSRVMTFFPLTAPVTALVRHATGTLEVWETVVVLVVLFVCAVGALALGVRLFREGSIAYDRRLRLGRYLRPAR